jgi:hypothetical protein
MTTLVVDQGSTAYIASCYDRLKIDISKPLTHKETFTAVKWLNGVSLPPTSVPFCARCQLDTTTFDPAVVSLAKYEIKLSSDGIRPLKGQYAECSPYCLWYSYFSEQRRVRQQEWQRVEKERVKAEQKRYAEELKGKRAEEALFVVKQKENKRKESLSGHKTGREDRNTPC